MPEVPDALWFKGKNITDFLKAFNNMCDDHSIESIEQLKKVCYYCERYIHKYVCSLVDLKKNNWESFKKLLIKKYKKEDINQQRQT